MSILRDEEIQEIKEVTFRCYKESMSIIRSTLQNAMKINFPDMREEVIYAAASSLFGMIESDLCAISRYLINHDDFEIYQKCVTEKINAFKQQDKIEQHDALSSFVNAFVKKAKETNG